jgi:hypothetical protein
VLLAMRGALGLRGYVRTLARPVPAAQEA